MADLLDTDPLDLLLDSSGDLVIENGDLGLVRGLDGIAQCIRVAVLLCRGEWFLNLDAGIPYFERDGVAPADAILGQIFDEAKTVRTFASEISRCPGVDVVTSVAASYLATTRQLQVSWVVRTVLGDTIADSLTRSA